MLLSFPGRPPLAAAAGILLTPVLYAIFPALTTRMLPLLCVVPVVTLGWLLGPVQARGGESSDP